MTARSHEHCRCIDPVLAEYVEAEEHEPISVVGLSKQPSNYTPPAWQESWSRDLLAQIERTAAGMCPDCAGDLQAIVAGIRHNHFDPPASA